MTRRALARLFKDTVIYGVAGGMTRFLKVLLVPVVARAFPAEAYGLFDAMNVYAFVLVMAGLAGLDSAVAIFGFQRGGTDEQRRASANVGLRMVLVLSSALALLAVVGADAASKLLVGDDRFGPVIRWAAASVPFSAVVLYFLSLLKWLGRRGWYVTLAVAVVGLNIGLTYLSAVHTSWGVVGLFYAQFAAQLVGVALGAWACRDLLAFGAWPELGRALARLGIPYGLVGLSAAVLPSIDRFFLVHYHTLAETGLYGLGQKVSALLSIPLFGFQTAWAPFALSMKGAEVEGATFRSVFTIVLLGGLCGALALVLGAPVVVRLASTPEYAGASAVVGPLALSVALTGAYYVVSAGAFLEGDSVSNLKAYAAGLAATVGANVLFAGAGLGFTSVAWANCFGQAVAAAIMSYLSHRVRPIPYAYFRGVVLLAVGAAVVAVVSSARPALSRTVVAGGLVLVTLVFLGACWRLLLEQGEKLTWASVNPRNRTAGDRDQAER